MAERISDAEHVVREVLWDAAPLTAQEVVDRVDPKREWSGNTVKTLLGRLLAKQAITHEEDGRRYLYRPLVERDTYLTGESKRLIDRLFGGKLTPLVAHLAEQDELTADDVAEIEALLKALKS